MNALIYAPSGGGKTVNATLVSGKKNLLICTDNSSIVLNNFKRDNLTIVEANTAQQFIDEFAKATEKKLYDNIILDNLSDLFDMWILDLEETGKFKDMRQAYQLVYQSIKRLARKSAAVNTNVIWTAWDEWVDIINPDGSATKRNQPKLPAKIISNVCGLMNVVARVRSGEKDGSRVWWYDTKGTVNLMAKDQIACRDFCKPETIFAPKGAGNDK